MTERGEYRHLVTLQGPGTATPDGEGGFTYTQTALVPPTWYCSIRPASQRDLERATAGTTLNNTSHIVEGDYRSDINLATQIVFNGRTLYINGIQNVDERNITLILLCSEVVS